MSKEWTEQLAEAGPFRNVYPEFLRHISPIEIVPEQIVGRVLVIGQASAFPEKTLICTLESGFKKLRDEVEVIYCCDTAYPSSPETHIHVPCINTASFKRISNYKSHTVYWELSSCYEFLSKVDPDFFNAVLMFRAIDLGNQIRDDRLVETIAPHLKTGGFFIGSGGEFPQEPPSSFFNPLELVRSARLSDDSDGFLFTQNRGIVLQRIE